MHNIVNWFGLSMPNDKVSRFDFISAGKNEPLKKKTCFGARSNEIKKSR